MRCSSGVERVLDDDTKMMAIVVPDLSGDFAHQYRFSTPWLASDGEETEARLQPDREWTSRLPDPRKGFVMRFFGLSYRLRNTVDSEASQTI